MGVSFLQVLTFSKPYTPLLNRLISVLRQATNTNNNNNYFWELNPIYYTELCSIECKGQQGDYDIMGLRYSLRVCGKIEPH